MQKLTIEEIRKLDAERTQGNGHWFYHFISGRHGVYATDNELRYIAWCSDCYNTTPTNNEANARFIAAAPAITAKLFELDKENQKLRQALKFYGDEKNLEEVNTSCNCHPEYSASEVYKDDGKIAREALGIIPS